jgi:sodium transport system permease protein
MLPAAKLDLGTSLIPITGLMLLLRGLIENNTSAVLQFFGPVLVVTLAASWLAIRWVVFQFNSETILFRASERFSIGLWLRQVIRERDELPWLGHAALCVMIILVVKFFVSFSAGVPHDFAALAKQTIIVLVATVGMPAILMAMVLTRRPAMSLRLTRCRWSHVALGVFLALCLHPLFMMLSRLVMTIYPPSSSLVDSQAWMTNILSQAPSLWVIVAVLALAPAVIEELAFRGFILSGMQRLGNEWWGIFASSLAFGAAHAIFQQSIITFAVGIVLAIIAVRTGSLWPCIAYHLTHNGLSVCLGLPQRWDLAEVHPFIFRLQAGGQVEYQPMAIVLLGLTGVLLLIWLIRSANVPSVGIPRLSWLSLAWWQNRVMPAVTEARAN